MSASVRETRWLGEPAIELAAGGYTGIILPGVGANLVQLAIPDVGMECLRTPDDPAQLRDFWQFYGLPLLFPPNRIAGGHFRSGGVEYDLPRNSRDGRHHLHGTLRVQPWTLELAAVRPDGIAEAGFRFALDQHAGMFRYFPHTAVFRLTYELSEAGLRQTVSVRNHGTTPMPLGIGFHTALRVPFVQESSPEDYRLRLAVGDRWALSADTLPTGEMLPDGPDEAQLRDGGLAPLGRPINTWFYAARALPLEGRRVNAAVLTDRTRGLRLVYEVSEAFRFWALWNDGGANGYICPEPMTWAINAPNLSLPHTRTGMCVLPPAATWQAWTHVHVETLWSDGANRGRPPLQAPRTFEAYKAIKPVKCYPF
jgi:aldose 1-epimerase